MSSGVNVLRYGALLTGIGYGLYHQSVLSAQTKLNHIKHENEQKQTLIQKAKAEYAKKTNPQSLTSGPGGVISDPDDPKFDLEAFLTLKMKDPAS